MTRLSRLLLLALVTTAVPALAIPQAPLLTLQPGDPNDPVEKLGRYLRILSTSPRDLEALTGAGRAALDVGDANAALGFFARAEEIAPRDGRVKAGLGSALVQMEQPKEALKLFAQASDLGVPIATIAADRGLAYDLRGDNRRAQADYALALRAQPDAETTRRLALSQAMAGDRTSALATLDPLLRKQDKAAWRASTFVMAMTGDADGAVQRLRQLVLPQQATALAPFLGKLAALKPAQQAEAVHFGHLPTDGRTATTLASAEPVRTPDASRTLTPAGAPLGTPRETLATETFADAARSTAGRRRPGLDPVKTARTMPSRVTEPEPTQVAQAPTLQPAPSARVPASTSAAQAIASFSAPPAPAPIGVEQVATAEPGATEPALVAPRPATQAPTVLAMAEPALAPVDLPPSRPVTKETRRPTPATVDEKPVRIAQASAKAKPSVETETATKPDRKTRLAADAEKAAKPLTAKEEKKAASAKQLADASDAKAKKAADAKADKAKKLAEADKAAKAEKAKLAAASKKAPQRYWVQVATGANKADLPKAWAKVKEKYPSLMGSKAAWTTPLRFTNRLLVGPFKSDEEAQAFVNTSGKAGFGTSPFTSAPGQAVERLGAK